MAKGKGREKIKKLAGKVKKAVKGAAQGIVFAPLIPFRGFMEKQLKKAGAVPKKKMSEIAEQFFNTIIKKKGGSNFEGDETFEHSFECPENLVEDIVSIVKSIVGFFKNSKEKKEKGTATELEKEAAQEKDDVDEATKEAEKTTVLGKIFGTDKLFDVGVAPSVSAPSNKILLFVGIGLAALGTLYYVNKNK
jgi:hypothetical protein